MTLARTLYSTPLTLGPAGVPLPGLCTGWSASKDFRRWGFICRSAPSIAAALRRLGRLRDSPLHWVFADALVSAPSAQILRIRLPFAWRRFPYVLTSVATAPRFLPGPFSLVSGSAKRVTVRGPGLTVVFQMMPARAARRAFLQGDVDEAPVPVGDVAAMKSDPRLRVRTLLALDLVLLHTPNAAVRRAYWETANRGDYEQLVSEREGSAAYGLVGGEAADPARFRRALKSIPSLPGVTVRLHVSQDPVLRYGARLLWADWRDVGLGPWLVGGKGDATFLRLLAPYAQAEAIPAQLVLADGVPGRAGLLRAFAATQQTRDLQRLDRNLRSTAIAIPIAWVVDARLVSPRLQGWREDVLGNVDYAAVRSLGSSPRP